METIVQPFTPEFVKQNCITDERMIAIINKLLLLKYNQGSAILLQKEIKEQFHQDYGDCFDGDMLNFESTFERVGWKVSYHKHGFNETWFDPYFSFKHE